MRSNQGFYEIIRTKWPIYEVISHFVLMISSERNDSRWSIYLFEKSWLKNDNCIIFDKYSPTLCHSKEGSYIFLSCNPASTLSIGFNTFSLILTLTASKIMDGRIYIPTLHTMTEITKLFNSILVAIEIILGYRKRSEFCSKGWHKTNLCNIEFVNN